MAKFTSISGKGFVTSMPATKGWWVCFAIASAFFILFLVSIVVLFTKGVGIWGLNMPVAWAFAITNFIWWVGIAHAGTFISAILFLTRQEWRTAVSRLAETMTIFAVLCAGLFPVLHVGRPWLVYWLFPYYNTMNLWPQFRSPLVWDLFAVLTYLTISVLYWFLGLIPDLAIYRDRSAKLWQQKFYGVLALGWRGGREQWQFYKTAYVILAAIAAPLVISVHSIVGLDFAVANVPGWHSTIFAPYFVAGAIFSGFAMVLTIAIPLRRAMRLEPIITDRHLDLCARFILSMGMLVAYGYLTETFMAYYSGEQFEIALVQNRFFGPLAWVSWLMIFCNVVVPQFLWSAKVRANIGLLFIISILINVGMWCERFVIIVTSLYRGFLPSSWHWYSPTFWDWAILFGSMGFFATCYLLFVRFFPIVAISELRAAHARNPEETAVAP
jgi:Ni/Fe-hydrogenase subunit HybB-like protein